MKYVDGYVLVVPPKKVDAYIKIAKKAGRIWKEHGALEYRECIGDDLNVKGLLSFRTIIKAKKSETVIFSWIAFKSKAHRNRVNAAVMKDPRMNQLASSKEMPFDMSRMAYGGFIPKVKV